MNQFDAQGNPIVTTDDKGGTPPPQVTPPADDGKDDKGGKDDKKDQTVPSWRLAEESEKKRIAEAKVAEFERKEAERAEEKRKQDEADALKRGEHEKVIKEKDATINSYKDKEKTWEDRNAKMQTLADKKLEDFKTKYGEEKLTEAKTLIGSDDPWVIMEKIDSVESLIGEAKKPLPKGGSDLPGGGGDNKNLSYYQDKLGKGEPLTPSEQSDYYKLLGL